MREVRSIEVRSLGELVDGISIIYDEDRDERLKRWIQKTLPAKYKKNLIEASEHEATVCFLWWSKEEMYFPFHGFDCEDDYFTVDTNTFIKEEIIERPI